MSRKTFMELQARLICEVCKNSGDKLCPHCNGTGHVLRWMSAQELKVFLVAGDLLDSLPRAVRTSSTSSQIKNKN